ncbi:MAG: GNAT family N-acetyltransferase [Oscillospiraceae bacterium]|nr:GNAT family N-acetyltransferase [Oscillospiraceae bacterium]
MFTSKELGKENRNEIKALFKEVFMNAPWNDDWSDEEQLDSYLDELTGEKSSLTVGLFEDGELIGLSMGCIRHWWQGTEYYIFEFCIRADKQGSGRGTAFLGDVIRIAKEKGVTHIFLQTERSAPAYGFYRKNGFEELEGHVSLVKFFDE